MTLNNLVTIQRRYRTSRDKLMIYFATNHIPMRELDLSKVERCVKMLRRCHFLQTLINQELIQNEINIGRRTEMDTKPQKEIESEFEE